jgi:Tfp pilus assembly protein PilO
MTVDPSKRAYRRALTLGLTLAEIFVLILFVLLMAFAAYYQRQRDQLKVLAQLRGELKKSAEAQRKASTAADGLRNKNEYLERRLGISSDQFDEYFRQLSLCETERTGLQNLLAEMSRTTRNVRAR